MSDKATQIDSDLLNDFYQESKGLVADMLSSLEAIEGDFSQVQSLEEYGQTVDRIMGGAKSLAMSVSETDFIHQVGDYAALCKAVGYKASQIKNNPQFFDICVALLLDATEMLDSMLDILKSDNKKDFKQMMSQTFLDRLRWVSSQFSDEVRASVAVKPDEAKKGMDQSEIDDLLKKLGIG
jgi:chemotaxis protein histidine kinase CheA